MPGVKTSSDALGNAAGVAITPFNAIWSFPSSRTSTKFRWPSGSIPHPTYLLAVSNRDVGNDGRIVTHLVVVFRLAIGIESVFSGGSRPAKNPLAGKNVRTM
jgi:hypothetical protein